MKKRVISIILAICMLISVAPASAVAGTYQRPYQLTVNNQALSNEGCYLDTTNIDNIAINKIPTDADDHYAYFKDGVLTLKNVDLKYSLTVRSQNELTINLIGDNYINFEEQGTALRLEQFSKLTINGPGSLTIKSADKIENSGGSTVSLDKNSNLIINTTVNVYGANATAEGFSGNDAVSGISYAVFTIGKGGTLNAWGGNGYTQGGKALFLHQATFNVQKDAHVNLTAGVSRNNYSPWAIYLSGNEPLVSSYGHIVIDNAKGSYSREAILSDNDTAKINIFAGSVEVISKVNAMKTNLISVMDNVVDYEVIAGADKQAATKVETPDACTYTSNSYFKLTVNQAHDKYNITYKHTPTHYGQETYNISTIGNVPTRVPNDLDIFPFANSYDCLKYWEIGSKGSGNKIYPHKEYTFTGDTVLYGYYGSHAQFDLVQGKAPTKLEEGWKDYYKCRDCGKLFENIDRAAEGYGYIRDFEAWKTGSGKLERLPGGSQYTVKHLKENINAVGTYDLADTQIIYALPDSLTDAKANTYENYTAQPIDQVIVKADGSTVVEIKYDSVKYNLTWNFEGGTPTNDYTSGKVPVGADIVAPKLRKVGSQHQNWRSSTGESGFYNIMPNRDLTYTAVWKFYTNEQKGKPATCTESGYKTYYKDTNGFLYEDEFARTFIKNIDLWKAEGGNGYIAPLGHDTVTDVRVEPTYDTVGKTEGSHCSRCGKVFVPQQDISMLPMPVITFSSDSFTYNNSNQVPTITLTQGDATVDASEYTVSYEYNNNGNWEPIEKTAIINAGTYKAKITDNAGGSYNLPTGLEKTFTINKVAAIGAIPILGELTYNGATQNLFQQNASSTDGTVYYSFEENGTYTTTPPTGLEAKKYDIWWYVKGDANHLDSEKFKITSEIKNNWQPVKDTEYTVSTNDWTNANVTITAKDGYLLSTQNLAGTAADWKNELVVSTEGTSTTDFYVKNTATGEISLLARETTSIDTVSPTGSVTVGLNSWQEFVNTITFGLIYKDTQNVKIESADALSGVKSVEYYKSATPMTLDEVKANTTWTGYTDAFNVDAVDGEQFVIYVKITDNAGNVFYLSSDGNEFDQTPPVVTGIGKNVIYFTTQKVTITDKNLESVKLTDLLTNNSELLTVADGKCEFIIDGDVKGEYEITAKDKVGNETVFKLFTDTIDSYLEYNKDITVDNVSNANIKPVHTKKVQLEHFRAMPNNTAQENAKLDEAIANCEAMMNRYNMVQHKIYDQSVYDCDNIKPENVKLTDKATLEKAKGLLDDALTNYSGNLMDLEKQTAQAKLDKINDALDVVIPVSDVKNIIDSIPNVVEADDVNTVDNIRKAKADYDKLNDYQKSLVAKDDVDKLNNALASIGYKVISVSNDAKFTKTVNDNLVITVNASAEKFLALLVDGKEVDKANYTVESGSTIITVKADYLNTLSEGEHNFTVKYSDDECDGKFTVENAPVDEKSPATGSEFAISFGVVLMLGLSLSLITITNRKKKTNK